MTARIVSLAWDWGVLAVETYAGRLGPVMFVLPDGRQVTPFHIAPWFSEPESGDVPSVLRRLRGEWACVPFGFDLDRPAVADWAATTEATAIDLGHGYGANNTWSIEECSSEQIVLAIDYPQTHPIARLVRTIRPDPTAPAIKLSLEVLPRSDCLLPIGLHPTLRLPSAPGMASLDLDPDALAATFPGEITDRRLLEPGGLAPIGKLPLRSGGHLDARQLPFDHPTEELIQIVAAPPRVSLSNLAEGYRFDLSWNIEHFPSLLLWISQFGHRNAPWNGRHLALGLEPICSAFDLGVGASQATNPLVQAGAQTARQFRADVPFITRYRMGVGSLTEIGRGAPVTSRK